MTSRTIPIRPETQKSGAFEYISTRKDELIGWARKRASWAWSATMSPAAAWKPCCAKPALQRTSSAIPA
jgi:hypothetical protein